MFDTLKKSLYFKKKDLLYKKGFADGSIVPFDEKLYEKMSHTYISCIPVSMHIKYLRPHTQMAGQCRDRSLYMFFCFDDAWLVRGNDKELEFLYGKENSGHGWIEIDDYVYEPAHLLRFQKDIFYQIYSPTNVDKCSKEDYIRDHKDFYEKIKSTTLEDFLPGGRKRTDLSVYIPLLQGIAELSGDEEFKKDVSNYLRTIQYDEEQIQTEIQKKMECAFQKRK